jgi:hypothetical protein
MRRLILAVIPAIVLMAAVTFAVPCFAQNSDFNLSVHANSHATAKDIGLPVYPGATPFKDKDSDSSADLGFALNSVHFNLRVASFVTKCGFRSMWAVDSSGCGHRKRSDVGSDSVVMCAGKSN